MITRRGRWLRSCGGTAGHTGGPCPGPQTLACLGGSQCPCFSSPSPNRECAARTGVATTFPPSVAEGNFRPQPRWPRSPAPWILTRWAPQSPGGSPAPDPGRPLGRREAPASPTVPLAGALVPSAPRQSSCRGGGSLAYLECCSRDGGREMPQRRTARGFHCGEEGAGLPDPVTPPRRSSDHSNCTRRLSLSYGFAKCFHPQ